MSDIQSLLFDLDGTLTDPREGICRSYAYALECMGFQAPSLVSLEQYIGPPLRVSFTRLLDSDDSVLVEHAVAHYRERFAEVGLFENMLLPHASELLNWCCNQDFRVFLVTSKPQIYAEKILDHFNIRGFFNGVYGPQLDGRFDNKGELIAQMLSQEGLNPASAMMIGDRAEDVQAALRNEVLPIGLSCGFGSNEELQTAGAQMVFSDLAELHHWLACGFDRVATLSANQW